MPMVGETLAGRYRIDAALGAGATAVVYRAHDLRLGRDVAVKVLLPNLARDPLIAGRFDREARSLAGAAHPGIVSVYDVDRGDPTTGREPYFVMELCDGGSLADAMDDAGGRLPPETIAPILATVAGGLASLHARGMIHRDVKPHNILLCGTGAKLADFGLARAQDTTRLTAAGMGAGTLAYLAPELLGGDEPGPAADVYALGVVAFQALTGRLPRPSASMVDLVDSRLAPVAPVSAVAPDIGRSFDGVVGVALSPDPARRPPPLAFAAGLGNALQHWRAERHAGIQAPPPGQPDMSTQQIRVPRGGGRQNANRRSGGTSLRGPLLAAAALGVLAAVVILILFQSALSGPGPAATPTPRRTAPVSAPASASAGASASASATASASAAPSASPSPTASPSPSPTATPTVPPTTPPVITQPPATPVPTPVHIWDPAAVQNQLDNLATAILNAEAGHQFDRQSDADMLRKAGNAVQKALDKGNQMEAARAAQALSMKLQDMVDGGRLRNPSELQVTVQNLVNATGPA